VSESDNHERSVMGTPAVVREYREVKPDIASSILA
jgi:hypothetical protein